MMTFTFITALFLPATSTASLFSMSMFQWQTLGSDSASHVSGYFWVYWTVTIPLTLLTMAGWFTWYWYADAKWHSDLPPDVKELVKDLLPSNEHEKSTSRLRRKIAEWKTSPKTHSAA
jgi:hypothetical protein